MKYIICCDCNHIHLFVMPLDHASLANTYVVLQLPRLADFISSGCTPRHGQKDLQTSSCFVSRKSVYGLIVILSLRIALRTHPNKTLNNPDATEEFQRVAGAHSMLILYFDNPQDYDDYRSESDVKDYSNNDETRMDFCRPLTFLGLYSNSFTFFGSYSENPYVWYCHDQFKEYFQCKSREEQVAAQERRKREIAARKVRQEQAWERARHLAEQRRREKHKGKKTKAAARRRQAKQAIRAHLQKAQALRSAFFAAARESNTTKVKAGIWEEDVDAAGGEIKRDCERFVSQKPKDPQETLLHIAVLKGDHELVVWLDAHNADPEERNSEGLIAFHIALRSDHQNVVTENHSKLIYAPPESTNLLALGLDPRDPEVVWMILDKSLTGSDDISKAWSWVTSTEGYNMTLKPNSVHEALNDNLLMRFGGFIPPSTTGMSEQEEADNWPSQGTAPISKALSSTNVVDVKLKWLEFSNEL
ncbi:hypothetical protein IW261DRAFT_1606085 [Armillaria novae-zelandiae]|uniref:Uncharacterized protein n=1 Tax=Armillaria novae-zelandiae TaxID=153914 RepID=A0AA39PI51_9AGAR|nr:hypothetical protein IW261DRAFT_1606085 [Armillaria novae-zelandiae]